MREERLSAWHIPLIWFVREQPWDPLVQLWLKQMFTPAALTREDKAALRVEGGEDSASDEREEDGCQGQEREDAEEGVEGRAGGDSRCRRRCCERLERAGRGVKAVLSRGVFTDVASVQQQNKGAVAAHEVARLYDNKTEYLYSMLQVEYEAM